MSKTRAKRAMARKPCCVMVCRCSLQASSTSLGKLFDKKIQSVALCFNYNNYVPDSGANG